MTDRLSEIRELLAKAEDEGAHHERLELFGKAREYLAFLLAEVERLRSDRDCEKRLRKDAEERREDLIAEVDRLEEDGARLVSVLQSIPMHTLPHTDECNRRGMLCTCWHAERQIALGEVHFDKARK